MSSRNHRLCLFPLLRWQNQRNILYNLVFEP
jgi:hypothetical protein